MSVWERGWPAILDITITTCAVAAATKFCQQSQVLGSRLIVWSPWVLKPMATWAEKLLVSLAWPLDVQSVLLS